jgi:hypothetical protein
MLKPNDIVRARVIEFRRTALILASGDYRIYTSPPEKLRDGERWREVIQIGNEFDVLVAIPTAKGRLYHGMILEPDDGDDSPADPSSTGF